MYTYAYTETWSPVTDGLYRILYMFTLVTQKGWNNFVLGHKANRNQTLFMNI